MQRSDSDQLEKLVEGFFRYLDVGTCRLLLLYYHILVIDLCNHNNHYSVSFSVDVEGVWDVIDSVVMAFFGMDLICSNTPFYQTSHIDFLMEFQDQETFQMVRNLKSIAKKYILSGWFFIDFAATFPINYITTGQNLIYSRLFRLFRLPKLIKILDLSRFNRVGYTFGYINVCSF